MLLVIIARLNIFLWGPRLFRVAPLVSITTGARATIYASCYTAKGTQKEDTQEYPRMASYVGNRFQQQRKQNTLFEGLSRLMGAVLTSRY